jgi:hypothetical protein
MVPVFSPDTESEVLVASALLAAYGVECHVRNYGFGSLFPGMQVNAYNNRRIYVDDKDVELAVELLHDLQHPEAFRFTPEYMGLWSKVRIAVEALFFGHFVPGSRNRRWPSSSGT